MRIYIIHSPSTSENYIDNVLSLEQKIIENRDHVMNPLPDQVKNISNSEMFKMYKEKIKDSDMVFVMKGWQDTDTGNVEMAEAMIHCVDIKFEK